MKRFAPAAERNKSFILEVLQRILPAEGRVWEVASGSGQHTVFFAQNLPSLEWLPSDLSPENVESIDEYTKETGLTNVRPAFVFDVTQTDWWTKTDKLRGIDSKSSVNAVTAINMIHIAPWSACVGLFEKSAHLLQDGEILYLYGPFFIADKPTAPSNLDFDQSLKTQNPEWGIRLLEDVVALAGSLGFILHEVVSMPANNFSVIFKKQSDEKHNHL